MNAVLAIALKDLRLLMRDGSAAFFTLVFPLLLAMFFGAIFQGQGGGGGKIDLAVVCEDSGPAARAFVDDLKADAALRVIDTFTAEDQPPAPLTREQGTAMVRRGRATACVILPAGFGEGVGGMFAGKTIKIECIVAPGRSAEGGLLTGKLNEVAFKQLGGVFGDPAAMTGAMDNARKSLRDDPAVTPVQRLMFETLFTSAEALTHSLNEPEKDAAPDAIDEGGFAWKPVDVAMTELESRTGPRNSYEISFPQGVVWGLMGCVVAFGVSMASERQAGTLVRLTTAPITRHHVLAGKALGCFIACIFVQAALIALGTIAFRVRVDQPLMLAAAMLISAVGFTGVMMAMAGLARTEGAASGMGRAVILVLAMIGGGTVPLFLLPGWIQTASSISPFKWTTMAVEGALWRDYTWPDFALPAGVLLGFGVIGFIIGTTALKRGERV